MKDRPSRRDKVILVHVYFKTPQMEEDLHEFQELATSAGAEIAATITTTRQAPESKYFVGSGKAEEIKEAVLAHKAGLVIVNHPLSPAQERNLERLCQCRVIDRTGLILDIFAQRARSFEGKLQVELAQLKHLATRLVRGWTHLERQRGGIGLRGPGETQLETDRRLIRNRIKAISSRLLKLRKQRDMARRARRKAIVPTVALVGYTNAGKSTLFNTLTGATVYVANQLFATLDPTLRRIDFPQTGPVILADTVGFIRHLPPDLVTAFKATLEEVSEADLLLHVIDASDEQRQEHMQEVDHILAELGAEEVPKVLVFNKIDLVSTLSPKVEVNDVGVVKKIYISAVKSQGLEALLKSIGQLLGNELQEYQVILAPNQAKLRANLYERDLVLAETIDEKGQFQLTVRLSRTAFEKFFPQA